MEASRKGPVVARIQTAMVLYVFGVVGIFLIAVPWTSLWDQVILAMLPAEIGSWARSGWVRGAVSGVGALDLIAAAREAVALWRDDRAPRAGS